MESSGGTGEERGGSDGSDGGLVDRERFYASQLSSGGASLQRNTSSASPSLQASLAASSASGAAETLLDETRRRLFNAVEALSAEKEEKGRVRAELVKANVRRAELADENAEIREKLEGFRGAVSSSDIRDLRDQLENAQSRASDRAAADFETRALLKAADSRCLEVERKWREERAAVLAELGDLRDWNREARGTVEALEERCRVHEEGERGREGEREEMRAVREEMRGMREEMRRREEEERRGRKERREREELRGREREGEEGGGRTKEAEEAKIGGGAAENSLAETVEASPSPSPSPPPSPPRTSALPLSPASSESSLEEASPSHGFRGPGAALDILTASASDSASDDDVKSIEWAASTVSPAAPRAASRTEASERVLRMAESGRRVQIESPRPATGTVRRPAAGTGRKPGGGEGGSERGGGGGGAAEPAAPAAVKKKKKKAVAAPAPAPVLALALPPKSPPVPPRPRRKEVRAKTEEGGGLDFGEDLERLAMETVVPAASGAREKKKLQQQQQQQRQRQQQQRQQQQRQQQKHSRVRSASGSLGGDLAGAAALASSRPAAPPAPSLAFGSRRAALPVVTDLPVPSGEYGHLVVTSELQRKYKRESTPERKSKGSVRRKKAPKK